MLARRVDVTKGNRGMTRGGMSLHAGQKNSQKSLGKDKTREEIVPSSGVKEVRNNTCCGCYDDMGINRSELQNC
jgi:hypothetical protein